MKQKLIPFASILSVVLGGLLFTFQLGGCTSSTALIEPSSTKIYYSKSDSNRIPSSYVIDWPTGTPKLFLANSTVLSQPRGGRMLVVRNDASGNWASVSIVDSSGISIRDIPLPSGIPYPNDLNQVDLSPTEGVLFYTVGITYHLMNLVTMADTVLTTSGYQGPVTMAFNRDGTRIAFYERGYTEGVARLVVANVDGTGRKVVTDTARIGGVAWSAAGDRLFFTRVLPLGSTDGPLAIWAIGIDGSKPKQLTPAMLYAWMPTVSPDGTTVAFTGAQDKDMGDIWTVATDGSKSSPGVLRRRKSLYLFSGLVARR